MTEQYIYDVWAPPHGPWSDWVKPVLFAHMSTTSVITSEDQPPWPIDVSWAPPADGRTAVVLDLPGTAGVWAAMQLGQVGYRPVPLYNAVPAPLGEVPVCDLWPVVSALAAATSELDKLNLPFHAPPAFMLDYHRRHGTRASAGPGMFDNRSVSLPTDFPSANYLASQGISGVLLVQERGIAPQVDLAHTLLRWQQAGLSIEATQLAEPSHIQPIHIARPALFKTLWQRLLATAGLKRNPLGGFGGILPIPSSGG